MSYIPDNPPPSHDIFRSYDDCKKSWNIWYKNKCTQKLETQKLSHNFGLWLSAILSFGAMILTIILSF